MAEEQRIEIEREDAEKGDRLSLIIIHGPLRRVTHPSWKMKRRMPYASRERRAGKSSTPVSSWCVPCEERRPHQEEREVKARCRRQRELGVIIRVVCHASNNARNYDAFQPSACRPRSPPTTPLDNARQMYRLICQYCPTFVSPLSVCPADAYARPPGSGEDR